MEPPPARSRWSRVVQRSAFSELVQRAASRSSLASRDHSQQSSAGSCASVLSNSSIFSGRDTNLNNTNVYYNHIQAPPLILDCLDILQEKAALGGLHDAAERTDPPRCHLKTREAVRDRINQWAKDQSVAKPILWLTGAAGAGKSAILQTLVELWKEEDLTVPNFFFSRDSPQRSTKKHLIPTIAFQLAKCLPSFRHRIEDAIRDGSIFQQNLKSQVLELIIKPLQGCFRWSRRRVVVIVVDGFDECCLDLPASQGFQGQTYEDQQREIVEAFALVVQHLSNIRFLISSRPERQIRTSFAENPLNSLSVRMSLVDGPNVAADITRYLKDKFCEIRQQNPGINSSWPSKKQVALLVKKSSGQFIYPATVIKYIQVIRRRQFPVKSLQQVLELQPESNIYPLAELDALYTLVLQSVASESWPTVKIILGLMCYTDLMRSLSIFKGVGPRSIPLFLERFLLLAEGELSTCLTDLHSILYIPEPLPGRSLRSLSPEWFEGQDAESSESLSLASISQDTQSGSLDLNHIFQLFSKPDTSYAESIRFMHITLSEYLINPSRSRDFFISRNDILLECSLIMLKHIEIDRAMCPPLIYYTGIDRSSSRYNFLGLYEAFTTFVHRAPPSSDLMMGIWIHLKDDIGQYNCHAEVETSGNHRDGKNHGSYLFHHPDLRNGQTNILQYLLECNNPDIEPCQFQREAVDCRLKEFIFKVNPENQIAIEYMDTMAKAEMAQAYGTEEGMTRKVEEETSRRAEEERNRGEKLDDIRKTLEQTLAMSITAAEREERRRAKSRRERANIVEAQRRDGHAGASSKFNFFRRLLSRGK